jgi:hypothetical protein
MSKFIIIQSVRLWVILKTPVDNVYKFVHNLNIKDSKVVFYCGLFVDNLIKPNKTLITDFTNI